MTNWKNYSKFKQVKNTLIYSCTQRVKSKRDCAHCYAQCYCNESKNKELKKELIKRNKESEKEYKQGTMEYKS